MTSSNDPRLDGFRGLGLYLEGRGTQYVYNKQTYKYHNPTQDPFQGTYKSTYYLLTKSPDPPSIEPFQETLSTNSICLLSFKETSKEPYSTLVESFTIEFQVDPYSSGFQG